jgi:Outer membrane protein beta-barrel domain
MNLFKLWENKLQTKITQMKNKITVAALLIIIFSCSNVKSQSWSLGVEAGVNLANVTGSFDPDQSPDSRTGIIVGGIVVSKISKTLDIVSGIRYVGKGYTDPTSSSGDKDINLDYIEFPFLLKVNLISSEVNPYLAGGYTLGVNVSAKAESGGASTDIKKDIVPLESGFLIGGGVDYKVAATTKLFIQIAYYLGVTNFNQKVGSLVTTENYGVQITTGVFFGL